MWKISCKNCSGAIQHNVIIEVGNPVVNALLLTDGTQDCPPANPEVGNPEIFTHYTPDICHFLTPAPFPAEKFDTKKRVNRNTTDFATKQRKSIFHRPKKGYSFKRRRVEGRVVVGGYVGGRVVK